MEKVQAVRIDVDEWTTEMCTFPFDDEGNMHVSLEVLLLSQDAVDLFSNGGLKCPGMEVNGHYYIDCEWSKEHIPASRNMIKTIEWKADHTMLAESN